MNYPYGDLPLIDSHTHIMQPASLMPVCEFPQPSPDNAQSMVQKLDYCGLTALNIPAITLCDKRDLACNPLSLYAKILCPDRIYAYAGLRREPVPEQNADMLEQLKRLLDIGFDGVKILYKPNVRKQLNLRINDPMFNDFFEYMEQNSVPLLLHVGDPAIFWDTENAPDWARESGWFYGDDKSFPSLDSLYADAEEVLERFPKLSVVLAHFFFLSSDLERAAAMFDKYPCLSFDLTPGREMYVDFSKNPEATRQFFIKYQDRLIFGTDNFGASGEAVAVNEKESAELVDSLRRFFETSEEIVHWNETLHGISLPKEVCQKIYADNFLKVLRGKAPKPIDREKARALCVEYISLLDGEADSEVCSVLESLRAAF